MTDKQTGNSDSGGQRGQPRKDRRDLLLFGAGVMMPLQMVDNAIVLFGQALPISLLLAASAMDPLHLRRSRGFVPLVIAVLFVGTKVLCGGTLFLVVQYAALGLVFLSIPRSRYGALFRGMAVGLGISVGVGVIEYVISLFAPAVALSAYREMYGWFQASREIHWNLVGNVLPLPRVPGLCYEPAFLGLFANLVALFMFARPKALSGRWFGVVVIALLLANSRTATAGALVLAVLFTVFRLSTPRWVKGGAVVGALVAPVVILLAAWSDPSRLYLANNPSYFARIYPISRFVTMKSETAQLFGVCNYERYMTRAVSNHPISYAVVTRLQIMKDAKSLMGNSLFQFGIVGTLLFWFSGLALLGWTTRNAAGWAILPLVFLNVAAFSWVAFWAIWGGIFDGDGRSGGR